MEDQRSDLSAGWANRCLKEPLVSLIGHEELGSMTYCCLAKASSCLPYGSAPPRRGSLGAYPMDDMDGGPEAMSRGAGNKSQTRARGVDERSEPCRARPNAEFADRGKSLILRVNARPRGYRAENAASWLTSSSVKEGPIPMLEQTP